MTWKDNIPRLSITDKEVSIAITHNYTKLSFDSDKNKYGSRFSNIGGIHRIEYDNLVFKISYSGIGLEIKIIDLNIPYRIFKNSINKKVFFSVYSINAKDNILKEIYNIEMTLSFINNLVYDIINKEIYFKCLSLHNVPLLNNNNSDNAIFKLAEFLKRRDTISGSKYLIIKIRVE